MTSPWSKLTEFFQPLPHYEAQLATVTRSNGLTIIEPKNGVDIKVKIHFELDQELDSSVKIKIEDNKENLVYETLVSPDARQFDLDLSEIIQHPGRYYWKLKYNNGIALGMFYIGKDLDPSGDN